MKSKEKLKAPGVADNCHRTFNIVPKGKPYHRIIGQFLLRTSIIGVLAVVTALLIRSAGHGRIGNYITSLFCRWYDVDWYTAVDMYQQHVRSYYDFIMMGTMVLCFLAFFLMLLIWFTKYFDEMIDGVDQLADRNTKTITLSPELAFMSDKLNKVKDELERGAIAEREAEQHKNDLIVYLAHDIRTPLTSVIGYLNLLDEMPEMPPEQRAKYVHITVEKAYRLEKLINELFETARYNAQSVSLSQKDTDISYMLVQVIDEAYPLLAQKGKTITSDVLGDVVLNIDPDKMARALNNVLRNAVAYSDEGSNIDVSLKPEGRWVVIRFTNDGTIEDEKLERIFQKFYRGDSARQSATGGSGLGLTIARDIIELHGGIISAECSDGRTTFTIELPDFRENE